MGTSSYHKYREAKNVMKQFGIELERLNINKVEIQADDPRLIAEYSLKMLNLEIPIVIEDAGLYIDKYNGFPGPYSSYILKTLNNIGILKLMVGDKERSARYLSVVAYRDLETSITFTGEVAGRITNMERGSEGFGYDPIFIPNEGNGSTFAEMSLEEKSKISHRARAFRKLADWLINRD
jgi:XTP/dITP diphosphohydrolase